MLRRKITERIGHLKKTHVVTEMKVDTTRMATHEQIASAVKILKWAGVKPSILKKIEALLSGEVERIRGRTRESSEPEGEELSESVLSSAENYLTDALRETQRLQKSLEEAMEGVSTHIHRFGGSSGLKSAFQEAVRTFKPMQSDGQGTLKRLLAQVQKERKTGGGPEART